MTEWLLLLAAVALTALTGFFVAAEFALTTVDRGRAEEAARSGDRRAGSVVRALRTLSTQLSAAQLGITITTLIVGYLAEPALGREMGQAARRRYEQGFSPAVGLERLVEGYRTAIAGRRNQWGTESMGGSK